MLRRKTQVTADDVAVLDFPAEADIQAAVIPAVEADIRAAATLAVRAADIHAEGAIRAAEGTRMTAVAVEARDQ